MLADTHTVEFSGILVVLVTILGALIKGIYNLGAIHNEVHTIRTNDLEHLRIDVGDVRDKLIEHLEHHAKD